MFCFSGSKIDENHKNAISKQKYTPGRWRVAEGPSGTLVWRALGFCRNTGLAGGQRPPLLDCSGGHVYGGRPKAAIDHVALRRAAEARLACSLLIRAPVLRKCTGPSKHFKRSFPAATQQISTEDSCIHIPFGPPLAGLNF